MDLGSEEKELKGGDGSSNSEWNVALGSSTKIPMVVSSQSPLTRGIIGKLSKSSSRAGKLPLKDGSSSSSHSSNPTGDPFPSLSISDTHLDGHLIEKEGPFVELPPVLLLEVFSHLDARELCAVACVCSQFRRLAADSNGWEVFYCERWGLPPTVRSRGASEPISTATLPGTHWRELYVEKEARSKSMLGRYTMDLLHGHTSAIRAIRLLPEANLICTGGYDLTVRLWNLEQGLPIACSKALGGAVRSIALDTSILVVGSFDSFVRVWPALPDCPHLFDVAGSRKWGNGGAERTLRGHTGPVTCVGLDSVSIYSGSWDMSIRVWSRSTLKCVQILEHTDWVWALVVRGGRVLSTAGSDVYSWEAGTGTLLRVRREVHVGKAYAVEGTRSGHIIFTGGEDGGIRMFDDRVSSRRKSSPSASFEDGLSALTGGMKEAVASWNPHGSSVYSLAFHDPWLVSASGDGFLAMMDVRQIMKRVSAPSTCSSGNHKSGVGGKWRRSGQYWVSTRFETPQRRLGGFPSAYCVDIGSDRVVCGGEEKIVRVWDFSQALEREKKIQEARSVQVERRMRRKEQQQQQMAAGKRAVLKEMQADDDTSAEEESRHVESSRLDERPEGSNYALEMNSRRELEDRRKFIQYDRTVHPWMRTRARYVDSVSVPS